MHTGGKMKSETYGKWTVREDGKVLRTVTVPLDPYDEPKKLEDWLIFFSIPLGSWEDCTVEYFSECKGCDAHLEILGWQQPDETEQVAIRAAQEAVARQKERLRIAEEIAAKAARDKDLATLRKLKEMYPDEA